MEDRLLERYLETLGRKLGMDEARLKLLYFMEKRKEPCSVESLCLLTGMGRPAVIAGLARLLADGLVRREQPVEGKERFSFQAAEYTEELRQLNRDVDAICFAGFTDDEIRQYRNFEERISNSILRHMQAETAENT